MIAKHVIYITLALLSTNAVVHCHPESPKKKALVSTLSSVSTSNGALPVKQSARESTISDSKKSDTHRTRWRTRWHTRLQRVINCVWGTGSFKENYARRLATLLNSVIIAVIGTSVVARSQASDTILIYKHKCPNCNRKEPQNMFVEAACTGNIAEVERLLKTDEIYVNALDIHTLERMGWTEWQETALHASSKTGHAAITRLLLDNRAHVDALDSNMQTPLMKAAHQHQIPTILLLLDAKANVNAHSRGSTPISFAQGDPATVDALLQARANVCILDAENNLPLHYAAYANQHQGVGLLLRANTIDTINHANVHGNTPLHDVAKKYVGTKRDLTMQYETVKVLLDHRADPNLKNKDGKTPLDLAEHQKIKKLLQQHMTSP